MPWDGAELFENRTLAKLGQVERLLATEQHWCKGSLRDASGRHCLVGAIVAVGGRRELMRPVIRAAREVSGKRYWRIEAFNDDPNTTHRDVMRVLSRTRQNLLADIARPRQPISERLAAFWRSLHHCPAGDADAERGPIANAAPPATIAIGGSSPAPYRGAVHELSTVA